MTDIEPKEEEGTQEVADDDLEDVAGGSFESVPYGHQEGLGQNNVPV